MKDLLAGISAGAAVVVMISALCLIGPVLVLWVVNSLAAAGGSGFYIEHNLGNYWVALIFLLLVRGGK